MTPLTQNESRAIDVRPMFVRSLVIPLFSGFGAWALASGVASDVSTSVNYLEKFGILLMVLTILSAPIPYIFHWTHESKYFGASLFPFASGALLGIYPALCIVAYSNLPIVGRLLVVVVEAIAVWRWCARFGKIYFIIERDLRLFRLIYKEQNNAVFYLQQGDKRVIEQELRFNSIPSGWFFFGMLLAAILITPFASDVSRLVGTPFIHVFLALSMFPTALLFLGLATKMWIVHYVYPIRIERVTGKRVYVDLSSSPPT